MGEKGSLIVVIIGALFLIGLFPNKDAKTSAATTKVAATNADDGYGIKVSICDGFDPEESLYPLQGIIINNIERSGLLLRVDVWPYAWDAMRRKTRMGLGLMAWCSVAAPNGKGTVHIYSARSDSNRGDELASVIDGSYSERLP